MGNKKSAGLIFPADRIWINASASAVECEEASGPLGAYFDIKGDKDALFGTETFEKAEAKMQYLALSCAMQKAGVGEESLGMIFSGDLLNQCVSSAYGLLDYNVPFIGLFGACSTCAEGLLEAAAFCPSQVKCCACVTSSHNCTSERQFRFPLEYGGQRPPSAQWTVTGSGAFIVSSEKGSASGGADVEIADAMAGISVDYGINDANDMGAAMAPAAYSTLDRYFRATGSRGADYDLIVTGDLGRRGSELFSALCSEGGYDISRCRADCGELIYDIEAQDKHSGGSGCGCSAAVMASYIVPGMRARRYSNVLFIGTGALMNPQALMQGENIVGIAHLVHLRISD